MGIEINGKPLKDYIKEQKEKGEVLEDVCGTQNIGGCCINTFHSSQVFGVGDGFVLTNNARVTINRNGKKYTLKGDRIEKRNGNGLFLIETEEGRYDLASYSRLQWRTVKRWLRVSDITNE